MACPMSALALSWGTRTPILSTPSSTRTFAAVVGVGVNGGAALSELQPCRDHDETDGGQKGSTTGRRGTHPGIVGVRLPGVLDLARPATPQCMGDTRRTRSTARRLDVARSCVVRGVERRDRQVADRLVQRRVRRATGRLPARRRRYRATGDGAAQRHRCDDRPPRECRRRSRPASPTCGIRSGTPASTSAIRCVPPATSCPSAPINSTRRRPCWPVVGSREIVRLPTRCCSPRTAPGGAMRARGCRCCVNAGWPGIAPMERLHSCWSPTSKKGAAGCATCTSCGGSMLPAVASSPRHPAPSGPRTTRCCGPGSHSIGSRRSPEK